MVFYRKFLLLPLLAILYFPSCGQQNRALSPDNFEQALVSKPQVLDVRTPEEFRKGYIENAMQADWLQKGEFKGKVMHLEKDEPVYVYCASGGRSAEAAEYLRKSGFKKVYELKGGFLAWNKANKAVIRSTDTDTINLETFNALISSAEEVLVDIGAEWCPPCRKMEPVLGQFQASSGIKIIKIDAGSEIKLINQLNIKELPTFIFYKSGVETERMSGLRSLKELTSAINSK